MRLTTPEISWHGKEPLFSLDFSLNNKSTRLVTSGADSNIRIWAVHGDDDKGSKVEFMANLSRHTKAVNVVRFSPQGNMLASGGDDCYVIIWKLNDSDTDSFPQLASMESGDIENKESWQVAKMLRGHIEDVYDLAWSPNATQLISGSVDNSVIIWDTNKGDKLRILKDHRQYVQGVSWDPCGTYVASYSCDRTCRIYNTSNYRCCYNINKMTLPNSAKTEPGNQNSKQIRLFHDETMPSFFRRLTFSPDGLLLLVPGGKFEVKEKAVNTTFVFTKASMNKPVMYFPATKKPTIAVKCCPVLFELRNTDKNSNENNKSVFKLPYRMVIAVASLDSVVLYDTQRSLPFGFLSNMHYASLTDIAWSSDGKILAISSRDGYCSLVTFDDKELGVPYSQTASEVIENATVAKESSPSRRNVTTPRSKTPDSTKDERTPPKIEKLSIKNFVTVNAPKPNSSQLPSGQNTTQTSDGQDGGQKIADPASRRVSFVSVQPSTSKTTPPATVTSAAVAMATVSMATQPRRVNITTLQQGETVNKNTQNINANSSSRTNTQSVPHSTIGERKPDLASAQQPRRVGFVTLNPSQSITTPDRLAKSTSSHAQASNVNATSTANVLPSTCEQIKPDTIASTQEPRRVGFVTLKSPQSSSIPQRSTPTNPSPSTNQNESNPSEASEECEKSTTGSRRVNFVTLKPSQNSTIPQRRSPPTPTLPTSTNHDGSNPPPVANEEIEGCTSNTQPPPRRVNFVTIQPPLSSTGTNQDQKTPQTISGTSDASPTSSEISRTSVTSTTVQNNLARQDRPPVPLEPEVTIINH